MAGVKRRVTFLITHGNPNKHTYRNPVPVLTESEALVHRISKRKLSRCMPKACGVIETLHRVFFTFIVYLGRPEFVQKMNMDIKLCKSYT